MRLLAAATLGGLIGAWAAARAKKVEPAVVKVDAGQLTDVLLAEIHRRALRAAARLN